MTLLNILKHPNIKLKIKAEKVEKITKNIINISQNMIETMIYNNGIGLAATQVDIKKRIIVINVNTKIRPLVLINPIILNKKGSITNIEGCLSFPDFFIKVKRNKIIKIKFINLNGEKNIITTDNLLSVCIQHEIDHLNGITLYDKISNLKKKLIKKWKI